jgi:hypothetical protein
MERDATEWNRLVMMGVKLGEALGIRSDDSADAAAVRAKLLSAESDDNDPAFTRLIALHADQLTELLLKPAILSATWNDGDENVVFNVFAVGASGMPGRRLEEFELPFPRGSRH